jgi:hypothetical protein
MDEEVPQKETSPPQEARHQGKPGGTANINSELGTELASNDDSEMRLVEQTSLEQVHEMIRDGRKKCAEADTFMAHFAETGLTRMNFVHRDKVPDPFPDKKEHPKAYKRELDELLQARKELKEAETGVVAVTKQVDEVVQAAQLGIRACKILDECVGATGQRIVLMAEEARCLAEKNNRLQAELKRRKGILS